MGRFSLFALMVFLVSLIMISHTSAYMFYVGGRNGWVPNPSESYNTWAERTRFSVNDTLVFIYGVGDSVFLVTKDDYNSCNISNPIEIYAGGYSEFDFQRSGPFFFISGAPGNCEKNQKLIVVVLAVRHGRGSPPKSSPPSSSPASPPQGVSHGPSPVAHPPSTSPAPSSKLAPSPTPSSKLAPSPTPSSKLAPSPTPSSKLGPSPTPSSRLAPSPTPSSKLGPSPSPSSKLAPSPLTHVGLSPASSPPGQSPGSSTFGPSSHAPSAPPNSGRSSNGSSGNETSPTPPGGSSHAPPSSSSWASALFIGVASMFLIFMCSF